MNDENRSFNFSIIKYPRFTYNSGRRKGISKCLLHVKYAALEHRIDEYEKGKALSERYKWEIGKCLFVCIGLRLWLSPFCCDFFYGFFSTWLVTAFLSLLYVCLCKWHMLLHRSHLRCSWWIRFNGWKVPIKLSSLPDIIWFLMAICN